MQPRSASRRVTGLGALRPQRRRVFAVVIIGCVSACAPAKKQSGQQQPQEEKHTGVISGTVITQRGEPVADVTVRVHPNRPPERGRSPV